MIMQSLSNPFVYINPFKSTLYHNLKDSAKLKIPLLKFPGIIGHSTSRVNRLYNDDTYSLNMLRGIYSPNSIEPVLNMSLFDGHGVDGKACSTILATKLHLQLVQDRYPAKETFFQLLYKYSEDIGGIYWNTLYKNREKFYTKFIKSCNTKQEQVLFDSEQQGSRMLFDKFGNLIDKNSLLNEYTRLKFFQSYLQFDIDHCCNLQGGSTASSIYISPFNSQSHEGNDESFIVDTPGLLKLVVTQIGDSRIIICDSHGIAHNLSQPHHPSNKRESQRLGRLLDPPDLDAFGQSRFLNNYANTRSFGDIAAKRHGLSAEPDIYSYLVGNTKHLPYSEVSKLQFGGNECFIMMVTDGVTDLLSDQECVDLVTTTVNLRGMKMATPQFAANEVIEFISTIAAKDADNATCLILRLPNWGNWPAIDRTGAAREVKLFNS
ncbi:[Pyruvate dehydrogenase [acetyl-transferring]]-phosphatase 2, mitochondrial [Monosporozyma servazzii]